LFQGSLDITQSLEDDPLLDAPLISSHTLHSQLRPRFHAIPAVLLANFLLLIHVSLRSIISLQKFAVAILNSYGSCRLLRLACKHWCHPIRMTLEVCVTKVDPPIEHTLFSSHLLSCQSSGMSLLVYRSTRHLKRLPLLIHSTGNAALLLILSVQHSFPDRSEVYLYLILGVLGLELISSLTCLVIYTVKISNFNRAKPRPDIIEEEKMYAYPSHITSEIGFRENSSLEEIVEKQGDVIEYLQRHNALLSKRLLALTSQQIKT
ncbi:TM192 protein, partial [Sula dactylatra]|nr:TM192 protein [Sula dactylatra]